MKTVELSAALGQAQVVENLKNFVGVDAQGAAALMTPERLAAVAGELANKIGGAFFTSLVKGSADGSMPIKVAEEVLAELPSDRHTAFLVIHANAGVRTVRGLIYNNHTYGFFVIEQYNGISTTVILEDGILKLKV